MTDRPTKWLSGSTGSWEKKASLPRFASSYQCWNVGRSPIYVFYLVRGISGQCLLEVITVEHTVFVFNIFLSMRHGNKIYSLNFLEENHSRQLCRQQNSTHSCVLEKNHHHHHHHLHLACRVLGFLI